MDGDTTYARIRVGESAVNPVIKPTFFIGCDLGQSIDPSALCILERIGENPGSVFRCRFLKRFSLLTRYPTIVREVIQLCETEPLRSSDTHLVLDGTGVGRAVCDLFFRADIRATIRAINIHGGNEVTNDGQWSNVPKRELVSVTQACLQSGRLQFAEKLPDLEILKSELQNFQVSISESGFDSYNARSGKHDDMVLALALALWEGNNAFKFMMV